jgi:flagellar FliJ protein
MAKFTFRLQSYLSVKEQMEEQKKNEYGHAIRRWEEEKERLRQMERELQENIFLFKQALAALIVPQDIRRYTNRIELVKVWIEEQEARVKAAELFVEEKRLELVEAMKDRKALDTVKERNYEEYLKDEQRAEQAVADGIVSYQYSGR